MLLLACRNCRGSLVLISLALIFAGCNNEEKFYAVKGRILMNGQPLRGAYGAIALVPDSARGNLSKHEPRAELSRSGNYEIKTAGRFGAPAGWYKVQVMAQTQQVTLGKMRDVIPKWAVPIEYTTAEKTPISMEVVSNPDAQAYDIIILRR